MSDQMMFCNPYTMHCVSGVLNVEATQQQTPNAKPVEVEEGCFAPLHCWSMSSTAAVCESSLPVTPAAKDCSRPGRHVIHISASACLSSSPQPQHAVNLGSSIMMQGFGWGSCHQHPDGSSSWYDHILSKVPELQAAGISHIWLPPPSHSVSPEGYLPGQLYDLCSAYGTEEQLRSLIAALKAAGISPIADIVINHRCADEQDDRGRWNLFRDKIPHEGPSIAWGSWAITRDDHGTFGGAGQPKLAGGGCGCCCWWGAPNLDHSNAAVREGLACWLRWLQSSLGFEGWRFDYAKGYSSKYVQSYVDRTTTQHALNVGEVWPDLDWSGPGGSLAASQDAARSQLFEWVNGCGQRARVFDFVTKGILQEAVKCTQYWRLRDAQGQAAGLIGWFPGAAVTFVDNHDTGSAQQHWPFPSDRLALGYAYILTHPGVPCIFWEHMCGGDAELRSTIQTLIQMRQRQRITATSSLEITVAEDDLYVAVVDGRVTVKLGPRYDMGTHLPDSTHWRQVVWGQDFCVWEARSAQDACA